MFNSLQYPAFRKACDWTLPLTIAMPVMPRFTLSLWLLEGEMECTYEDLPFNFFFVVLGDDARGKD
ncbi:hypothetical protein E2C01_076496 [Portunus trituberculatus]|uniref:Uncharacterized protein n=1 Tax=Portunus trituberculatus TaxID=210409 RepID=A0A5B7IM66_PORTR|nr:hypothetical protein [Portunus trituberculatus]